MRKEPIIAFIVFIIVLSANVWAIVKIVQKNKPSEYPYCSGHENQTLVEVCFKEKEKLDRYMTGEFYIRYQPLPGETIGEK